ncbi:cysteine synthase A [Candidatus Methanosphaera massiliense]|uniref:cysteine synthase A n=1 Tax=Methanosphaera TaxID=2316 RepID=UPI0023804FEC|nr:cysteine synthase A [Candidatus Methanosphaera massiliense]MDD6286597.1 cysteine synthase A [Methanobacteriaceae archaeon]MDE4078738.1 cysteine synthase A [Candidatus Methanosphaera massiliense]MDY2744288.1 cysteine synthase A [Methanosphaera sp.]
MENIKILKKPIANDITETIGNTPLVRLNKLTEGIDAEVLVKVESFNPVSSVKDRVAVALIEDAEKKGKINKDTTIIEPTSGNTGVALAFAAAAKGYKLKIVLPESFSIERRKLVKIFGADLVLTPAADGIPGAIKEAERLNNEIDNSIILQQFENQANPEIHEKLTGQEILKDTDGNVDILISAVGTGGTVTGIARAIKKENPDFKAIAVEAASSPVLSGGEKGSHKIQGISPGFVAETTDLDVIDEIITVTDEDAGNGTIALAQKEGILAGISSGAAVHAALEVAKRPENKGKTIVAILADTGERYLSVDWLSKLYYE